jgi:uncharacterized RDD family membrane protein YckC
MPPLVAVLISLVILLVLLAVLTAGRAVEPASPPAPPPSPGEPSTGVAAQPPTVPLVPYATFPRRANALTVDGALLICLLFLLLVLPSSLGVARLPQRVLAYSYFAVLFLYDPLLVVFCGGTLGHRWLNLRVVDDQTSGNLSFGTAFVRHWAKLLLGAFSFLSMSFTGRHLALHDMLSRSSVQIRDVRAAKRLHYVLGPSATRSSTAT